VDIKEEFEVTLNLEQINYIINTLIVDTIISPTFNNDNARIIFDICENLAKAQGRTDLLEHINILREQVGV
jgi:hypothetical protein